MKNLKTLFAIALLAVFASGCESDSIEESGINQDLNSASLNFKTAEDLENYINQFPETTTITKFQREMSQTGAFTITSTAKELDLLCSETVMEDLMNASDAMFYGSMIGALNSETENDYFKKGDIQPGISITSGTGTMVIVNTPFLKSSIFNTFGADPFMFQFDSPVNTLGMDVKALGAADVIQIEVFNGKELLETIKVTIGNMENKFIGINSSASFNNIKLKKTQGLGFMVLDNVEFGSCISDSDGDGCMDDEDPFVNSNMEEFITINTCETGIANQVTSECGVMMSDLIASAQENAKNHGSFVSAVAQLAQNWVAEGLISNSDKGKIVNCAGNSKN